MASPEAKKAAEYFLLRLAAIHHGASIVPDELCEHVEMGAEMVGGVIFKAETPPKTVGMCQECVTWCNSNFDNPQPLLSEDARAALDGIEVDNHSR